MQLLVSGVGRALKRHRFGILRVRRRPKAGSMPDFLGSTLRAHHAPLRISGIERRTCA